MSAGLFPVEGEVRKAAVLSDEQPTPLYRYVLERWWCDPGAFLQRPATFVMLNPSIADADHDDPTIQRCMKFARAWGHDGIRVVNLYAWRATQPADMWTAERGGADIVGPDNDHQIRKALLRAYNARTPVIAAWGANTGPTTERVEALRAYADKFGGRAVACGHSVQIECLGMTLSGAPKHPLARGHHRIPDDVVPTPWPTPEQGRGLLMPFVCLSDTGPGPCKNDRPHQAPHGCVHHSTSGVAGAPKEEG